MDDKTFNLIEKMYSELIQFKEDTNKRFDTIGKRFDGLENEITGIKGEITGIDSNITSMKNDNTEVKQSINKINMTIEHDLMPKITVLFDGHIQNTQQLERIENAVDKHERIIIRKVK